jgi:hypothetical protein
MENTGSEDSFFQIDGDLVVPGPLAGGPWNPEEQHGGPVAGILAHLVETAPTTVPMRICRHTVELMRGAPMHPLRGETEVVRDGRRLQVVRASLFDGDREVARSMTVRLRVSDTATPFDPERMRHEEDEPPPLPDEPAILTMPGTGVPRFLQGVELRRPGGGFRTGAPGLLWLRMHRPLVAGLPTSPYVRMVAVSDMLSMVAGHLDPGEWLTVNVDLDLHTFRDPVGEWIGLRGLHKNVGDGIGLSEAVLYDLDGRIGRGTATILIDRRRGLIDRR